MSFWNRRQQIGPAALIMGIGILLARFMGLIRDKIISYLFGATTESDLYFAAFVIPDFINYLLAGAYFSITLIPLLSTRFEKDPEDGLRFFSAVLTWVAILSVAATAVSMVAAHPLARISAPGLPPEALDRLAHFLRIVLPAQIFFLLGACVSSVLYMRKQFLMPALTPIIYNLFIIAGGIILRNRGMEGLCWGVLAGAFTGNFLLPCFALQAGGALRVRPTLRHPALKESLALALPLMLGQSIVVLDEQFLRIFGSLAGIGAISRLNYARRIMMVPVGVVAQAAGVASYPFLSDLAVKNEMQRFQETIRAAARNVLTLLIPLSIWMITAAEPTIRLIFQQGRFSPADTLNTATVLRIMLVSVPLWGWQQILARGYYAVQDTVTPVTTGTAATVAAIPVFYWLTRSFGTLGVAAAGVTSMALYCLALSWRWKRRFGTDAFAGLGRDLLTLFGVTLPAAGVAAGAQYLVSGPSSNLHPIISALITLGASGLVFITVFLLLSRRYAPSHIRPFLERLGPLGRRLLPT